MPSSEIAMISMPDLSSRIQFGVMTLVATALFMGCGSGEPTDSDRSTNGKSSPNPASGRIKIVVTTGMVADIVRHVAGDRADVIGMIEPGVDPHLFKPTRSNIKQLNDADIVFYSGLHLEGRMTENFEQLAKSKKPVFAVTVGIDHKSLRSTGDDSNQFDPHVWMDVKLWSQCVDQVALSLAKSDPDHAVTYQQNAATYRTELNQLDEYARKTIASIPKEQRVLVTAHDAFGYFSKAYGIEVHSVQGVSTESEAGVLDVNRLVDFLVERKLPAIFVESSVNEKNIKAVIEGAKSRDVSVQIGGELFSDAMGPTGTYEGTYIGMIDHNVTTITRALGGAPPERGMRGKLGTK